MSKDINQSIAARHWLATDEQVRALAVTNYESGEQVSHTRGTFLQIEVARLQAALGMQPRLHARGKAQSFDRDTVMATYNDVHKRLYALVMDAVVTDDIKDVPKLRQAEKTRRALERNRRSNFARSAKAALAAYIRCGCNVGALVVPQVTKGALMAEVAKHKPKMSAADKAEQIVKRMTAQIERLREDDHELAQQVAQGLTLALSPVTVDKTTKSPAKSVEQGIPLQMGEGIFLPMPAANLSEIKPEQRTAH